MGKAFGSPRMAPALAVVLGLLALGASLADVPLAIARHQTGPGGPVVYMLVTLAVAVPGTAVGVLLAARRPRNPIGWLLLALLLLAANPASDYAILDYRLLKWLYTGATALICAFIGALAGPSVAGEAFGAEGPVVNGIIELGGSVFVICMGVAVLKYRLYAIDRIVSRVISYAVITVVLAGVFAGLVILATEVLPFKTPVAVAAATLAAAALFNPLRRRVQRAVDRRFNRARYDAETVVAAFTARLRHSADFDTVHGDLVSAVHQAFQPAHISLWSVPGPALRRRAPTGEGGRRGRIGG